MVVVQVDTVVAGLATGLAAVVASAYCANATPGVIARPAANENKKNPHVIGLGRNRTKNIPISNGTRKTTSRITMNAGAVCSRTERNVTGINLLPHRTPMVTALPGAGR